MSNEFFKLVLASDITSTSTVTVAMILADMADNDGRCWPSVEYVVTASRLGRSTVMRALADLEQDGYLTRQRRRSKSSVITLDRDRLIRKSNSGTSSSGTSQSGTSRSEHPEVPQRDGSKENPQRTTNLFPHAPPATTTKATASTTTKAKKPAKKIATVTSLDKARRSAADYTPEFETWWASYPNKRDKFAAFKAFRAALKLTTVEQLTQGATAYATEVRGRDPEHIKHGSTWLNGRCWENGASAAPQTADAATAWLRTQWQIGATAEIHKRTGLRCPEPALPAGVVGDKAAEFYKTHARTWIDTNRANILERLTGATT